VLIFILSVCDSEGAMEQDKQGKQNAEAFVTKKFDMHPDERTRKAVLVYYNSQFLGISGFFVILS
jgi:hypothetical protein